MNGLPVPETCNCSDFNLTLFTCVPLERESAEDGANFLGKIVRMMSVLITLGRKVFFCKDKQK